MTLDDRRIRAKLHQAIKVAKSATKKARQHELQRHVRRLKQCEEAERSDLEKELHYLKTLDIHAIALRALSTKLVKNKILPKQAQEADARRFPFLPFAQEAEVDPAATETLLTYETKTHEHICNQVLSSKVLASELAACLASLIPLVTQPRAPKAPLTWPMKEADNEPREENAAPAVDDYESDDGMGNQQNVHMQGDMDTLVAPGSDTEDSDDDDTPLKRDNASEQEEEDTFLPSLHTGFIPAADGDDWSDAEADYADTGGKGPAKSQRKNRRGQRERRAIWEKKYGRHANHLKLREKEPRKAREHRVPDRPTKRPKPMHASPPREPRTRDPDPPSSSRAQPAPTAGNAPLHPSWIAKQRAKEAQHAAKPQGTKVVFD